MAIQMRHFKINGRGSKRPEGRVETSCWPKARSIGTNSTSARGRTRLCHPNHIPIIPGFPLSMWTRPVDVDDSIRDLQESVAGGGHTKSYECVGAVSVSRTGRTRFIWTTDDIRVFSRPETRARRLEESIEANRAK